MSLLIEFNQLIVNKAITRSCRNNIDRGPKIGNQAAPEDCILSGPLHRTELAPNVIYLGSFTLAVTTGRRAFLLKIRLPSTRTMCINLQNLPDKHMSI